ncbi:MAG: putative Peptidoglycan glycosyltransferase [Candidatus Saccharibacteria bacterium]|nr:putative Peptidoglycan glycosyltransferase [Candidatus Saccharibacteria bacterium]
MKLELQKGSRSRILAGFIFAIVGIFIIRLFYLQIIQHNYYVGLADNEQIKSLTIYAKRGLIYGLEGSTPVPLVLNQTVYTVTADPYTVSDDTKVIDLIEQVAGGNAQPNLSALLGNKESRYAVLAKGLTTVQAQKLKDANFPGIELQQTTQRVYPEGTLAAQALGFVDYDGNGQYGVEGELNSQLAGTNGLLKTVTDVSDVPLTIGDKNINKPAVDGKNVVLSIDRAVQSHVEQALVDGLKRNGGDHASAVVMDPATGKVLAMANVPTFDPANYSKVQDAADFNNPVVSAPYEPGSDMKTLTMAVGIDKGVVTPTTTYSNLGYIDIDGIRVLNGVGLGHLGNITLQTAMNNSLNSGFITVAEKLGDGTNITLQARDTMYDYFYNKFKLGQVTGIEVSGELPGTIIPPTDPQGNAVRYSNMAFGQGLDVTMIQVASAFSSIVDGGLYHKPTVIAGSMDANGNYIPNQTSTPTRSVSQSTADQVREMTHVARDSLFANVDRPGYEVGGKTGTSQTLINGNYDNNQTVGTYLGYGGDSSPKYVIMIQVSGKNKTLEGGRDAEPIFADISNWLINYLQLQPKG